MDSDYGIDYGYQSYLWLITESTDFAPVTINAVVCFTSCLATVIVI